MEQAGERASASQREADTIDTDVTAGLPVHGDGSDLRSGGGHIESDREGELATSVRRSAAGGDDHPDRTGSLGGDRCFGPADDLAGGIPKNSIEELRSNGRKVGRYSDSGLPEDDAIGNRISERPHVVAGNDEGATINDDRGIAHGDNGQGSAEGIVGQRLQAGCAVA